MSVPDDVFEQFKAEPYAKVRAEVRDGDLLFCSARDPMSKLIRWATKAPWSHVAIAYRIAQFDRVMVLESVERYGVRTTPLSTFISRTSDGTHPFPGRILLARHKVLGGRTGPRRMKALVDFAFDRLGDPFANREMLKIFLRLVLGRLDIRMPRSLGPDDEFICSEYVGRCFEKAGIRFEWDGLGFLGPGDIARDPKVEPVAQIRTR